MSSSVHQNGPSPTAANTILGRLAGGGEMGALTRSFDWSLTPLGPLDHWPGSLLTAAGICLNAPGPCVLWWSPDLVLLYNDACRPLLEDGSTLLGRPGCECRPELWSAVCPMLLEVCASGAGVCQSTPSLADRPGFTLLHAAIRDESGGVGGVLTQIVQAAAGERARAQATLRDSEAKFRRLVEAGIFGLTFGHFDGRIQYANDYFLRMVGYDREDLRTGRLHWDLLTPPDMRELVARKKAEFRERGCVEPFEKEYLRKDGSRMAALVGAAVLPAEGEREETIIGFFLDLTERKGAEAAVRESEERYRDLFENANDVIYTLDLTGRITSVNKRAEQAFGYTCEECVGRHATDLVPAEYLPRMQDALRRKLNDASAPITTYDLEVVSKGGRRVPLEVSSRLILRAGKPVGIQGIARDITERRLAEESLRILAETGAVLAASLEPDATLQRLAGLLAPTMADWCFIDVLTEDRTIRRVAVVHADPARVERAEELFRLCPLRLDMPEAAVLRTGEAVLLSEMDEERVGHWAILHQLGLRSGMTAPLTANGQVRGAITLVAAESGRRYGQADLALVVELARRAALALDNARLYRELQEADRRKDEFLAMLAHELRNPLGPIRNAVAVLRMMGPFSLDAVQVRDMIERQVTHLARLVDDLLDVSRISRGKVLLRKVRLDLVPLVRTAAEDHRALLEATGLQLSVDLPGSPVWVMGDPTRLAQVVGNLLHNASKFTDAGGRVMVRLTIEADRGGAVLSVQDTGIGLGADILGRLFEPFSQADRSLDRSRGGLGLGLALVKGLAELHGGGVQASSAGPGRGSEFAVRLPLSPEASVSKSTRDRPSRGRSLRVLIVEDNLDAAETLRLLLELSGHQVEVAHTGAGAVEAAQEHGPEVVLCDIGLPGGMDGYAVARTLRADPEQSAITLIALSGYGQEEDQRQAREAGFDWHLTKPADPVVLAQLLAALPVRPRK